MLSHGELQPPPPPPLSYVAHSSTQRDGRIELDYVSSSFIRLLHICVTHGA